MLVSVHPGDGVWPYPRDSWWPSRWWWVAFLWLVGDQPLNGGWSSWGCWVSTLEMVGDHPFENGWPSSGLLVTIFLWWLNFLRMACDRPGDYRWPSIAVVTLCWFCELCLSAKFQVFSTLSFFGWPSFGWCVTILERISNHPWQLSPGFSFVS